MLTPAEQDVARSARYFGFLYGVSVKGDLRLSPDALVARARGARFVVTDTFRVELADDESAEIASRAARDVASWLGFEADGAVYVLACVEEKERVFNRAAERAIPPAPDRRTPPRRRAAW